MWRLYAALSKAPPPAAEGLHVKEVCAGPNAPTTAAVLRMPLPVAAPAPLKPEITLAVRWGNALVKEDHRWPGELGSVPRTVTRMRGNRDCIDGMRSPWRAIKRMPSIKDRPGCSRGARQGHAGWGAYGSELSQQLGSTGFAERGSAYEALRQVKLQPLCKERISALSCTGERQAVKHTRRDAGVADAWSLAPQDPERVFIDWLEAGCAGGTAVEIADDGAAPKGQPGDSETRKLEECTAIHEPCSNYLSVNEVNRAIKCGGAMVYPACGGP